MYRRISEVIEKIDPLIGCRLYESNWMYEGPEVRYSRIGGILGQFIDCITDIWTSTA